MIKKAKDPKAVTEVGVVKMVIKQVALLSKLLILLKLKQLLLEEQKR